MKDARNGTPVSALAVPCLMLLEQGRVKDFCHCEEEDGPVEDVEHVEKTPAPPKRGRRSKTEKEQQPRPSLRPRPP
eukprot:tig00020689_g12999.t1